MGFLCGGFDDGGYPWISHIPKGQYGQYQPYLWACDSTKDDGGFVRLAQALEGVALNMP